MCVCQKDSVCVRERESECSSSSTVQPTARTVNAGVVVTTGEMLASHP